MKTIHTVSLSLLVFCFSMIPNLGFGEPSISLHPAEAFVSTPTEDEVLQTDKEVVQVFSALPSEPAKEEIGAEEIPDPLEPMNRAFFKFNDKLYFWFLKPVATAYKAVFSTDLRVCFRNFFSNLKAPIRVGNCLLQAKFKGAGNETGRFFLNSTFGFFDQAKDKFQIEMEDRDFGQTLGIWGLGPSFYIDWPILGPSSLRDTGGFVGDLLLDPRTYLLQWPVSTASRATEVVNNTSLTIGEYEDLKKAAVDPYVAMRDAYFQYRQHKIKNR